MSKALPLLSLRGAANPLDPSEILRQVPPGFDPSSGPPARFGFQPEAYVPERAAQTAPPSFGRQLLEGLANAIGGTQLQPGPGATFKTAGLPILGFLASQILTAPIRKGQQERERLNQYLEEEAGRRRSEGMERRKVGWAAWNAYIKQKQEESALERRSRAAPGLAGETSYEEELGKRRAALKIPLPEKAGKGMRRITKADLLIPGFGQLKEGQEIPEDKYLDVITRAPSEATRAATRFGARAAAALVPLEAPAKGGSLEDRVVAGGDKVLWGLKGPRPLMSTEQKLYQDARLAWTLATLREESKANITTSEYENVDRAFFAQPGDNAATIAQKRQMRRVAQEQLEALGEGPGRPEIVDQVLTLPSAPAQTAPIKTKIVNGKIVRTG